MIVGSNYLIDIERRTFIKHHLDCPAKFNESVTKWALHAPFTQGLRKGYLLVSK
jgi:hypothetical protein